MSGGRQFFAMLASIALCAPWAWPTAAQLSPTVLTIGAAVGPDVQFFEIFGANVGSAAESYDFSDPFLGTWSGSAEAEGGGERSTMLPPTSSAHGGVTVSSIPNTIGVIGTAGAGAAFLYEAMVVGTKPSPIVFNPPTFVDVTFNGSASITGNASFGPGSSEYNSSAQARVTITQAGGGVLLDEIARVTATQRQASFGGVRAFRLSPGALLRVRVEAGFNVAVMINGSAAAIVSADPIFTFNQAAFDAYALEQGFPTFPLAEYYHFEYSPGYFEVPEPAIGSVLLFAPALVRRRRRR